jgi:hypothetical protein
MRKTLMLWSMNSPQARQLRSRKTGIKWLLATAIKHHKAAETAVKHVAASKKSALEHAWRCGQALNKIKPLVGHGNWQGWVQMCFCEPRGVSYQTAALYMKIDRDNPNIQRVGDLKFDSIRQYAFQFIPAKERPELPGNRKIPRLTHHLTVLDEFNRLKRRHEIGLQPLGKTGTQYTSGLKRSLATVELRPSPRLAFKRLGVG